MLNMILTQERHFPMQSVCWVDYRHWWWWGGSFVVNNDNINSAVPSLEILIAKDSATAIRLRYGPSNNYNANDDVTSNSIVQVAPQFVFEEGSLD
jgi:hypothetical protein